MQAELLMVLTCAGYVAPYAWDRLRAEWRNRPPVVQVDTVRLHFLLDELDGRLKVVRIPTSITPRRIRVSSQKTFQQRMREQRARYEAEKVDRNYYRDWLAWNRDGGPHPYCQVADTHQS